MLKYYPIQTKVGQEVKATDNLNREFDGRCGLPTQYNAKGKIIARVTGYTFLRLELEGGLETNDSISKIRSMPGTTRGGLIRFGDHFGSILDEIAVAFLGEPVSAAQAYYPITISKLC